MVTDSMVIGLSGLLLDTALDEEQHEYASTVHSSAQSLLVIINDTLDFSRLDAGKMILTPALFDLRETMQEVIALFEAQASTKGLSLSLRYPAGAPAIGEEGAYSRVCGTGRDSRNHPGYAQYHRRPHCCNRRS